VMKDFFKKLRARVPSYDEFEVNLSELRYLSDNTRDKPVVQYLLRRLHERFAGAGNAVDYTAMTIDHIHPENPAVGPRLPEDDMNHPGFSGGSFS
jgi:hypothetical protein